MEQKLGLQDENDSLNEALLEAEANASSVKASAQEHEECWSVERTKLYSAIEVAQSKLAAEQSAAQQQKKRYQDKIRELTEQQVCG